jgi:glycine dehydrogenase subunit 1
LYFPHSETEKKELLDSIGAKSFEDLVPGIPRELLGPKIDFPHRLTEAELIRVFQDIADKNGRTTKFIGAGAYEHFVPSAVRAIVNRGEFATAYTPYQSEASQGTLQALYEFQSMIAELYAMEVSNACLYDGATALAEGVLVALKHNGRKEVVMPETVHPHHRQVVSTYLSHNDVTVRILPCPDGVIPAASLSKVVTDQTACVIVQNPNFFGCLEETQTIEKITHGAGALLIASSTPISLGVIIPPGEYKADIAVGEGQPLGMPLSYGGPYLGLFTCTQELIRRMPGRIVGQTVDRDGKTSYVLTLQAREQHIRREKATSNICSNQSLCALAATVTLAMFGPEGLKELAELNTRLAHHVVDQIIKIPGYSLAFKHPYFNEFAIRCPKPASEVMEKLSNATGMLPGLALGPYFPALKDVLLINVTETKTAEDIKSLIEGLSHV